MIEQSLNQAVQWMLAPVLASVAAAFAYALWCAGALAAEALQRRRPGWRALPDDAAMPVEELELMALRRLEPVRLLARVSPLLGLIATMIPLGPALQAVATGRPGQSLAAFGGAFTAVVLSLAAAAIGQVAHSVRRRWLLGELLESRKARGVAE